MPVVIADWEGDEHLVSMLVERANWRQIVIVPTVAWLLILRAGQRIPVWLTYPTAAVWASVAVLRTAAV